MGDYPDYTTLMQIIGTDVTIPIEIKAVTVAHIDVDLAAQSIGNIAVAIAASTVTLNVAIASSAVTINVDVKAQTLTDFKITVNAQNVGVYLQPDWQTKAGTDKNLYSSINANSGVSVELIAYLVPASTTFYVCQWGFNVFAATGIMGRLMYKRGAVYTILTSSGGYSGNAQSFTKPIAITAGDYIYVRIEQYAGVAKIVTASVGGYEI